MPAPFTTLTMPEVPVEPVPAPPPLRENPPVPKPEEPRRERTPFPEQPPKVIPAPKSILAR